jgi:hypothetical protein
MFCPGCGVKEDKPLQYCRACGADLRAARTSLERPDEAVASIGAAREEIARAIAVRIKDGEWWQAGTMIPQFERLFESQEERRLRLSREDEALRLRLLRVGTITASVGLGLILLFLVASVFKGQALLLVGPSLLVFLIGLGVIVNGLFFTVQKRRATDRPSEEPRVGLPRRPTSELDAARGDLLPARTFLPPPSVTEHTTQHLPGEALKPPRV